MVEIEMATKGTRKTATADDLKAKLEKAKVALKALEKRAFAGEITEAIKNSNIPAEYKKIKELAKDVTDLAILEAIGLAVGIKRLVISQTETKTRTKKVK